VKFSEVSDFTSLLLPVPVKITLKFAYCEIHFFFIGRVHTDISWTMKVKLFCMLCCPLSHKYTSCV